MSRRSPLIACLCLALALTLIPAGPVTARTASVHDVMAQQFLGEINAERVARGLAPLRWDPAAAGAASGWAAQMARSGSLRHSGAPRPEIIGVGSRTGQVTEAWMLSAGHRRLISDPNAALAGAGVSCDHQGRLWVAVQFVKANPAVSAPAGSPSNPRVTPGHSGLSCASQEATERSVRRLYLAYLGRDGEHAGVAHWATMVALGRPMAWVSDQFAVSGEFIARYGHLNDDQFVHRAYLNVLGRGPDPAGRVHWLAVLRRHGRGAVMLGFADSTELRVKSGLP